MVDKIHWKKPSQIKERSNQFHVAQLLGTIDSNINANNNGYYTNSMFQKVMKELEREEERIRQTVSTEMTQCEIRTQARRSAYSVLLVRLAGVATGVLVGAFLGVVNKVNSILTNWDSASSQLSRSTVVSAAQRGAVRGAMVGYQAASDADSVHESVERVLDVMINPSNTESRLPH